MKIISNKFYLLLFSFLIAATHIFSQTIDVQLDLSKENQTINGFGAAVPDWLYGNNTKSSVADKAINDLGMTILRVYPHNGFEPYNENSNPFDTDLDKFNLTQDGVTNQIKVINNYASAGLQKLILSVFSPPGWMKTNGSVENGGELRDDMYDEFAEFYTAYIKYINSKTTVGVYAISPENEPRWGQWYASCVYNPEQMRDVIKVLGPRFETESVDVKIFAAEDLMTWFDEYSEVMMADSTCKKYTDIIATHAYSDGISPSSISGAKAAWRDASAISEMNGKELWMTETSGYSENWNANDGPLAYSQLMHTALKYGNVSGWIWLTLNTGIGANEQEALMVNEVPKKIYYASKNFYRYIRPGAVRIDCSDDEEQQILVSAFKHSEESRLTVVAINKGSSSKTINLNMENKPNEFTHYRTSETENCVPIGTTNGIEIELSPFSINTFVAEGINHLPTINKVKNMSVIMGQNNSYEIDLSGISDGDSFTQNLDVSVSSSNPSLIPNPTLNYSAGQTTGTLVFEPQPNESGTATITITLQDDGGQDNNGFFSKHQMSFDVLVVPFINQKPTIDSIPDQNVILGSGEQTVILTGISDGNVGSQNITITESKSNNNLIRNTKINYVQGENLAKYIYTPRTTGSLTVTLTLTDDGGSFLGGTNETSTSFNINITTATFATGLSTSEIVIYPNPASNIININTHQSNYNCVVEICNITGETSIKQEVSTSDGIIIIPTEKLTDGMYIVKVTSGEKSLVSKVLIQK